MRPPKPFVLSLEDYRDAPEDVRPVLDRLFSTLNPFALDTATLLDRKITLQNLAAEIKTITVRVPPLTWKAFDSMWTNAWTTTAGYTSGCRVDDYGVVHLKGVIDSGGMSAPPSACMTLPVGYRPASERRFATTTTLSVHADIRVASSGVVTVMAGDATNGTSLDGIYFEASTPAAVDVSVGPGWPIALDHSLGTVSSVLMVQAMDLNVGVSQSHGGSGLDWTTNRQGQIEIRRIFGLIPERTYRLTFLLLAGDG